MPPSNILPGPTDLPVTLPGAQVCTGQCTGIVLYVGNRDGNWDIFREAGSAEADVNLTESAGDEYAFSISPDQKWITYAGNSDGNWEIYVAPTSGDLSLRQRITINCVAAETDPAWGPGNLIAYTSTRDGNHEIYVFDTVNGREFRASNDPANELTPSWTPDGQLLYVSDRTGSWQVYRLNLENGSETQLSDGVGNYASPIMSPDGSHIAYRKIVGGDSIVLITDADGSNPVTVSGPTGHAVNPAWSPNSRYLAFQSDVTGNLDVYAWDTTTNELVQVTDAVTNEFAPQFRCDSTTVVFASDGESAVVPLLFDKPVRAPQTAPQLLSSDAAPYLALNFSQIYPLASQPKTFASREGVLPTGPDATGGHTQFTFPDVTVVADPLATINNPIPYTPVNACLPSP